MRLDLQGGEGVGGCGGRVHTARGTSTAIGDAHLYNWLQRDWLLSGNWLGHHCCGMWGNSNGGDGGCKGRGGTNTANL